MPKKKRPMKQTPKPPAQAPENPGIVTGAYPMSELYPVIRQLTVEERFAKITVPRSWAMADTKYCPILPPRSLRLIDICVSPDKAFPKRDTFVVETGKRKYPWKT
jgi:hypothetical protein